MFQLTTTAGSGDVTVPCQTAARLVDIDHDTHELHPSYYKSILPLPPYPVRPPARVGQIWWPCWGASRFAVGHVLVTAADYASMIAVAGWTEDKPVTVTLTDDAGSITLAMFVLTARPFNDPRAVALSTVDAAASQCWILTLVDGRYGNAGIRGAAGSTATWGDVVATAGASLGMTQSAGDVETLLVANTPAYPTPVAEWWLASGVVDTNNAIRFDAACAAVGLRVAYSATGVPTVQGSAEALTAYTAWLADVTELGMAGGVFASVAETPKTLGLEFDSAAANVRLTATNTGDRTAGTCDNVVNYTAASGDRTDYLTRFQGDMNRWLSLDQIEGVYIGYVEPPLSSAIYGVAYHCDREHAETHVVRAPAQYPWPMAATKRASGGSALLLSETETEAATEMAVDTDEPAPIVRALKRDFVVKKGATVADPKTWAIRYLPPVTFIEKLCADDPVIRVTKADGYITGIFIDDVEVTEGGIPFPLNGSLQPQRKTAKLPAGATITELTCSGLDTTCCASTWWCTGPDGSPSWTVVEVAYGDTPPADGFGPYTTEAEATAACVEPDPGEPVEVACCPDNPVPRLLTITEVGGGSFPMEYSATIGTGAWGTAPLDFGGTYPGKIPLSCGGEIRIVLNGNGSCTITASFGDGHECEAGRPSDPVITCSPFSMTFDLTFTLGDACGCIGQTRTFIITE